MTSFSYYADIIIRLKRQHFSNSDFIKTPLFFVFEYRKYLISFYSITYSYITRNNMHAIKLGSKSQFNNVLMIISKE